MGVFSFLKGSGGIDRGVEAFRADPGAVLIDVREPDEYAEGRIPGSRNIPLSELEERFDELGAKDAHLYVYCLSGGRSGRAEGILKQAGFTNVKNIGGISDYKGEMEK